MPTVMITGANRGIGLELARQYAGEGCRVIATCRRPGQADALRALGGNVSVHGLDVRDGDGVAGLASALSDTPIDILINNAGIYGEKVGLGSLNFENWLEVLAVNSVAPLRVAEAFLEHVAAGSGKTIVMVTSKMGSITDNTSGGAYIYRSSKAALNAAAKSLALDIAPRGMKCILLHPGWVQTDMGGPNALISVEESAGGMRGVIDGLSDEDNGGFFDYSGKPIPW